ncbi:MAG TPA: ferritin-like protein [Allosphingosinicella sp.]|jgi:hypothetical protein
MSDRDLPRYIQTIEELRAHLQAAVELEHSTIPPYLCGLYTIRSGKNEKAAEIIRTVVVEEMLHFVLAANVLNAVGGSPSVAFPRFVPAYPATLPLGTGGKLEINLLKFSEEAIDTFLAIEKPAQPAMPKLLGTMLEAAATRHVPVEPGQLADMLRRGEIYDSIGDFYQAIEDGLKGLEARAQEDAKTIFVPDDGFQITRNYYYNSGGEAFPVSDLDSALKALKTIVDQGEGYDREIFDGDDVVFGEQRELAHYYRFNQIKLGRCYVAGDTPQSGPTGATFEVDYGGDAVWDMMPNPSIARLPEGSVRDAGAQFSAIYTDLLRMLDAGVNGKPDQLIPGVVQMFTLRDGALALVRIPLPNGGNAGPCFEFTGDQQ